MTPEEAYRAKLRELAHLVAKNRDADVLAYNGRIRSPHDDEILDLCVRRRRRPNLILLISTFGGDAHAAYRMARSIKRHYTKFFVMVAGFCKSAGTLVVLGADSLILLEQAELGPLDVQLPKADELVEQDSGLTPMQALTTLQIRAYSAFEDVFVALKDKYSMTTRTASEIACKLATGMYQPIFAQVDPMRIGEMERAVNIAWKYGERLIAKSRNAKDGTLAALVATYPSHDFAIDREEATTLFHRIESPSPEESALVDHMKDFTRAPLDSRKKPFILFLNPEIPNVPTPDANESANPGTGESQESREQTDGGTHSSDGQVQAS